MSNKFTAINLEQLLLQAEDAQAKAHAEAEKTKAGTLRGGNSGVVTDDGSIYGNCHRATLARYLGFDSPRDDRAAFFFSAGHLNEVRWSELLGAGAAAAADAGTWSGTYLVESEVPTKWVARAPSGREVQVTGSPDIVLVNPRADYQAPTYGPDGKVATPAANFDPVLLLELKKVCSSYRAVEVFLKVAPDSKHLVQAAHYSWQLGNIPGVLSYTSDNSYDTPGYVYRVKADWAQNPPRKIPPARQHFYFGWQDGWFCFIHPTTAQVIRTEISAAGIERYYTLILGMQELEDLGPRPSKGGVYPGQEDSDPCKYCPYKEACSQYDRDRNYQDWVDRVKLTSEGGEE